MPPPAADATPKPRVLGLDPGDRRIGIAVSDPLGWTAQPVAVIDRKSAKGTGDRAFESIRDLVEEYEAEAVIVGLPVNMDGSHGPRVRVVEAFIRRLREFVSIPIHTIDERLSTVEAEEALLAQGLSRDKRKRRIDVVAAQLILQRYLDRPADARPFDTVEDDANPAPNDGGDL